MNAASETEAQAAEWLSRRDRGGWRLADEIALNQWLDGSLAHRLAFLRLEAGWSATAGIGDKVLSSREGLNAQRRPWVAALAASLLLTVGGSAWLFARDTSVIHETRIGVHEEVALRDGSHLSLNTDTRIAAVADGKAREVWLDRGEVFFQIAHDAAHPFVVHAGTHTIKVLGTKFVIRRDGDNFRLAVSEGRVRLSSDGNNSDRPILLARGDVATSVGDGVLLSSEPAAALSDELAWRDGSLILSKVTLGSAAAQFNRYSSRKIVIANAATAAIRIGGQFATDNAEGFARSLETGMGLHVSYMPERIIISD